MERRRDLIRLGVNDFLAHRLAYFAPLYVSLLVLCCAFAGVGYAVDHRKSFNDSTGAGVGLLVGLLVWMAVWVAFIACGGGYVVRRKRAARRREAHVEAVRHRRTHPR